MHEVASARTEFSAGLRAFLPLLMSNAPLGLVCGAAGIAAGLTPWQVSGAGWILFAGSAQIVMTQLLESGAPTLVIIATASILNLRFMIYSTSLGPHFAKLTWRWRILLGYLITDQAYALSIVRYVEGSDPRYRHWYYFGVSAGIWLCWQVALIAGAFLGSLIPADWSLDFLLPLTFISIVVPLFSNPAMLLAGVAGGAAAVLLVLPLKLNMIAAAFVGVAVGLIVEKLGFDK